MSQCALWPLEVLPDALGLLDREVDLVLLLILPCQHVLDLLLELSLLCVELLLVDRRHFVELLDVGQLALRVLLVSLDGRDLVLPRHRPLLGGLRHAHVL